MRARLQKSNILVPPKYEKNLSSVLIYDDNDQVIFAVTMTPAGTYKFSHIGLDDFKKEIKAITGMTIDNPKLEEIG